jgi:alcohol dehydrogenase class IV
MKEGVDVMENKFYLGDARTLFIPAVFCGKTILGVGVASQVGKEAKSLGAEKALIVTDQGVTGAGLVEGIRESLRSAGLHIGIFDKVETEPSARQGDECAQLARQEKYDIVIGLGGGSVLDVSKVISIMTTNRGKILDYAGADKIPKKGLPMILLPTTSGTGSEVSNSLMVSQADNIKRLVASGFAFADVAIVDPLLTLSLPSTITAGCGIDALCHALEAYVSTKRHPFGDVLQIEAISLIAKYLPIAYAKGNNLEARFHMSLAATMAGLRMSGVLTIVHGMSEVLYTKYHLSHGKAVAIMLPYIMAHSLKGNPIKYAQIAKAMGENIEGLSIYEAAAKSVMAVKRLLEMLNISTKLIDYGVSKDDLNRLVEEAMNLPRGLFDNNPVDFTQEDIRSIFLEAF